MDNAPFHSTMQADRQREDPATPSITANNMTPKIPARMPPSNPDRGSSTPTKMLIDSATPASSGPLEYRDSAQVETQIGKIAKAKIRLTLAALPPTPPRSINTPKNANIAENVATNAALRSTQICSARGIKRAASAGAIGRPPDKALRSAAALVGGRFIGGKIWCAERATAAQTSELGEFRMAKSAADARKKAPNL